MKELGQAIAQAVIKLTTKAMDAESGIDALQYSQAALNTANALVKAAEGAHDLVAREIGK